MARFVQRVLPLVLSRVTTHLVWLVQTTIVCAARPTTFGMVLFVVKSFIILLHAYLILASQS